MAIDINRLGNYSAITGDSAQIMRRQDDGNIESTGTSYKGPLGALFRSKATMQANDAMRSHFLKTLADTYGVGGYATRGDGRIWFPVGFIEQLKDKMGAETVKALKLDDDFEMKDGFIVCGRPLTERRISSVVTAVKAEAEAAELARMSEEHSRPRSEMSPEDKQVFLDVLLNPNDNSFNGDMNHVFALSEVDLERGQKTTIDGQKFGGPGMDAQKDDYRASLKKTCNNDQGLMRLFSGVMAQGFSGSVYEVFRRQSDDVEVQQRMVAPFAQSHHPYEHSMSFNLTKVDGGYLLKASCIRKGAANFMETHRYDKDQSFDRYDAELMFTKVDPGTPGARQLSYTDDEGNRQTLHYKVDVHSLVTETKLTYIE